MTFAVLADKIVLLWTAYAQASNEFEMSAHENCHGEYNAASTINGLYLCSLFLYHNEKLR